MGITVAEFVTALVFVAGGVAALLTRSWALLAIAAGLAMATIFGTVNV